MNKYLISFVSIVFVVLFGALYFVSVSAFNGETKLKNHSLLAKIQKEKRLHVVLLDGKESFEYALLKEYADYLDVDLDITPVESTTEALSWVNNKKIDIISAGITKTQRRQKALLFGPTYLEVKEEVVCSRKIVQKKKIPRKIEELAGLHIMVTEDSSHSQTLQSLVDDGYDLSVQYAQGTSTQELLEEVADHSVDCTVANSNIYLKNLHEFSNLTAAFAISEHQELAWVLPKKEPSLSQNMQDWLQSYKKSGKLQKLKKYYYTHIAMSSNYRTKMFYKRMKTRLIRYEKYFKKYAKEYHIPWTLLAAMSYQESHWNPRARSFTGVEGLMMLTNATARNLRVKNRLDPEESIWGGTRHIKYMLKIVPKEVKGEDRVRFALAAYNVGMGHIYDAQKLAKRLHFNPNSWAGIKEVLPLLSDEKYYCKLQYGCARGSEPVGYVEAIYHYKDMLENYLRLPLLAVR